MNVKNSRRATLGLARRAERGERASLLALVVRALTLPRALAAGERQRTRQTCAGTQSKRAGSQEREASGRRRQFRAAAAGVLCLALAGCGAAVNPASDGQLRVVTTTGILTDLVRNVAGPHAHVTQLVPDGADPHSYEPRLRSVRDVAYADLAFSNYLMLEQHSIIRVLDANLPAGAPSISIAEEASTHGARILPLVESRGLDALWLGLRVAGTGAEYGATRASQVALSVTGVEGPGRAASFLTTAFGAPEIGFSSHDGFDPSDGYEADTEILPAAAHQHMSWAFSKPGIYRISVAGSLIADAGARPVRVRPGTLVLAVGVDPGKVARAEGRAVLGKGHADLTVDLDSLSMRLMVDHEGLESAGLAGSGESGSGESGSAEVAGVGDRARREASADFGEMAPEGEAPASAMTTGTGAAAGSGEGAASGIDADLHALDLDKVLVEVPARTLTQVPGGAGMRFLGHPGDPVYLLPQAVLGKHVHGEIDPHLWHDVHNAAAYVRVIRDQLIAVDPRNTTDYRARAARYLDRLEALDAEVAGLIASIPAGRRHLVTTHDSYAYLATAYGLDVAGVVSPAPGVEPSIADRKRLAATLEGLKVPAVFLEPQVARSRAPLTTIAKQAGVAVCPLYGDTLDAQAPTYIDMMRHNAHSLHQCLTGSNDA